MNLRAIDGGRQEPESVAAGADGFNLSDVGNSQRLVARHGHDLRYAHAWHRWLFYDGRRWAIDETGESVRRTVETIRHVAELAVQVADERDRKALLKHALGSERDTRVRAALSLAESIEGIPVMQDELDVDPLLLNVANGTIDLRTGSLRPHDRVDLISKIAPVTFDPGAVAPRFDAFLDRVFASDDELIQFVWLLLGYTCTGETHEQILAILYGSGANGKTTLLELVRDLLGDYGQQAPAETFLERRGGVPNDVARMRGARFVATTETGEGRRLNEVLVKRLVGGDTIAARFLHAEWFEFRPLFKAWLATNHKPEVQGVDEAIWRRIRLIPFNVTIPPDERDQHLPAKLRAELPGILAATVRASIRWQHTGLATPDAVTTATDAYRSDSDLIGRYIDDECVVHPSAKAKPADLYASFDRWCQTNGERPITKKAFGMRLADRGYTSDRTGSQRYWLGISIRHDDQRGDA